MNRYCISCLAVSLSLILETKAQVFSDMQLPGISGAKNFSLDINYSVITPDLDQYSYYTEPSGALGLGIGYGISKKVDIRLRYSFLIDSESNSEIPVSLNEFQLGPKVSLIDKKLSIYTPLAVDKIQDKSYWSFQPKVLVAIPLGSPNFLFSGGLGYTAFFDKEINGFLNWNVGMAISINPNAWMLKLDYERGKNNDISLRNWTLGIILFFPD